MELVKSKAENESIFWNVFIILKSCAANASFVCAQDHFGCPHALRLSYDKWVNGNHYNFNSNNDYNFYQNNSVIF